MVKGASAPQHWLVLGGVALAVVGVRALALLEAQTTPGERDT